jgi:hypothetical protein
MSLYIIYQQYLFIYHDGDPDHVPADRLDFRLTQQMNLVNVGMHMG